MTLARPPMVLLTHTNVYAILQYCKRLDVNWKLREKKSHADSVIRVTFSDSFPKLWKLTDFNLPSMLIYYLTQEAIIKFLKYQTYQLLITIISNLDFHKTSMFLIKSTSEIIMIKKSIKINIYKISVYLDPLNKVFYLISWNCLWKLIFSKKIRFILKPFNRKVFLWNPHLKLLKKIKKIGKKNCSKILVYLSLLQ